MDLDLKMEDRPRVLGAIALATVLALSIEILLQAWSGQLSLADVIARLIAYPPAFAIAVGVGWWLGTRTWPRRGAKLTRRLIARRQRAKGTILFLSDRPDAPRSLPRRIWEVVGFSAGVSVIVSSLIILTGASGRIVGLIATLAPLATLWGSFVLVPYWLLSRLGLRTVDAMRWLILPVSRRYADRLKLSNGVLILVGLGALTNVLFRAGASGIGAVEGALTTMLRVVSGILVVAAAAVAFYNRNEDVLAHKVELEAIQMGIRDGRGMSDGDFLPRLPPSKAP